MQIIALQQAMPPCMARCFHLAMAEQGQQPGMG